MTWGCSDWDAMQADINRGLLGVWGEQFEVRPFRQRANRPSVPDPSRPVTKLCAQFTRFYIADNFNPSPLSSKGLNFTEMAQRKPRIEFIAADLPYELRQGDQVFRYKTGALYEVTNPQSNGEGLIEAHLVERGLSANSP